MPSKIVTLLDEFAPRSSILELSEDPNPDAQSSHKEGPAIVRLRKIRMQGLQTVLPASHNVMQFGNEDVEEKLKNDFRSSRFASEKGYPDYDFFSRIVEELLKGLLSNDKNALEGCKNWLLSRADRIVVAPFDTSTGTGKSHFHFLLQYFRCLAQISLQEDSTTLGSLIAIMWQRVYRRIHEHEDRCYMLAWWRTLECA